MSKKTTVVKTPTITELMEGVRAPIKQWSGAEFAAGNSQAIANTLAAPIIATLMAANVTSLRTRLYRDLRKPRRRILFSFAVLVVVKVTIAGKQPHD